MTNIKILPAGDSAVSVEFGNEISPEINRRVTAAKKALEQAEIPGILETVPSFRALLVYYDPLLLPYPELEQTLLRAANTENSEGEQPRRVFHIPVCYEGEENAPDLPSVCAHTGLTKQEVIARHTGREYPVYMLGFLPGFAYLGGMDQALETPRLSTPRKKIFAGAVGIGGNQTGVYPIESPGGWRLIGKTPVKFYAPERENPILLQAGDAVRFFAVTQKEAKGIARLEETGAYRITVTVSGKDSGKEPEL